MCVLIIWRSGGRRGEEVEGWGGGIGMGGKMEWVGRMGERINDG
jgi:hypothetical protein